MRLRIVNARTWRSLPQHRCRDAPGRSGLAHGVSAALTGSVVLLAFAFGVSLFAARRARPQLAEVEELEQPLLLDEAA